MFTLKRSISSDQAKQTATITGVSSECTLHTTFTWDNHERAFFHHPSKSYALMSCASSNWFLTEDTRALVLLLTLKSCRVFWNHSGVHRSELLSSKVIHHNTQSFDESEENASDNSAPKHLFWAMSGYHDSTSTSSASYRVPWVLLLPRIKGKYKVKWVYCLLRKVVQKRQTRVVEPHYLSLSNA